MGGFDVAIGFPNSATIGMYRAHPERTGEAVTGSRLAQWVRWGSLEALEASWGRRLPTVVRPLVRLSLDGAARLGHVAQRGLDIRPLGEVPTDFERLAEESAAYAPCIRVRDSRYVTWRWLDHPDRKWQLCGGWRDDRLVAWVVFGAESSDRACPGRIVDVLAPDWRTTAAMLSVAGDALASEGHGVVTFDYLDPRPWSVWACRLAGFARRGIGPDVTFRHVRPGAEHRVRQVHCWYLTRGDGDLD
jgi:hypothetical protein